MTLEEFAKECQSKEVDKNHEGYKAFVEALANPMRDFLDDIHEQVARDLKDPKFMSACSGVMVIPSPSGTFDRSRMNIDDPTTWTPEGVKLLDWLAKHPDPDL